MFVFFSHFLLDSLGLTCFEVSVFEISASNQSAVNINGVFVVLLKLWKTTLKDNAGITLVSLL